MIVFSHELFSIQSFGGVTRCMIEIMRGLHRRKADWTVWAGRHGSEPLEAFRQEEGVAARVHADAIGPLPGRFAASVSNEWRFRRYLSALGPGVVHRTQYAVADMIPRRFAKVSTLHDMWTERPDGVRPNERIRSHFKRQALQRSDAIVCVSENSRRELCEAWPDLGERSVVIHHGVRKVSDSPAPVKQLRPFFLFVGAREARKNFPLLLRAFSAPKRLQEFDLICVGGGKFGQTEQALIAAGGLTGRVHQQSADDAQLAGLYEAAVALVYPSRFEGFGMPILEAMIHGCAVICAPVSCMPEIGGNAALYADAQDPEAWCVTMQHLAFDHEAAAQARAAGLDRARQFSWDTAAASYLDIYRKLGARPD